jgi:hypothetical protein
LISLGGSSRTITLFGSIAIRHVERLHADGRNHASQDNDESEVQVSPIPQLSSCPTTTPDPIMMTRIPEKIGHNMRI